MRLTQKDIRELEEEANEYYWKAREAGIRNDSERAIESYQEAGGIYMFITLSAGKRGERVDLCLRLLEKLGVSEKGAQSRIFHAYEKRAQTENLLHEIREGLEDE
jgi:aspartate/methionine/tyrosine aminotransferase